MNEATVTKIVAELEAELVGKKFGKFFALPGFCFVADIRPHAGKYLFASLLPTDTRIYLVERSLKQLNRESIPSNFVDFLRKRLGQATVTSVSKEEGDRIIYFRCESRDEVGIQEHYDLVFQLTGRSANIFLTGSENEILASLKRSTGAGQEVGTAYQCPQQQTTGRVDQAFEIGDHGSLSEALDAHYRTRDSERSFDELSRGARSALNAKRKKTKKLIAGLEKDLKKHGEPEKWKRLGDLVKANISTATRKGDLVLVTDYFDEELPVIELEIDENVDLIEAAEKYFKKYSKSIAAQSQLSKRIGEATAEFNAIENNLAELDKAVEQRNFETIKSFLPSVNRKGHQAKKNNRASNERRLAHEYSSSDGLTVLVGKKSKDNDNLTFKVAKSLDIWLHAADYPGSHVVIRRQGKQDIPERTLIEAAQLAAFYSKARNEAKAAVNYTERKFVNKPKGAAPGLVSLASFKTVLVEPGVPIEKVVQGD